MPRDSELQKNTAPYHCQWVWAFVTPTGVNSLDHILPHSGVTDTIDVLSVDTDGDDYHIIAGLQRIRPRVIICVYNPTIPSHVELVPEPGNYSGARRRPSHNSRKPRGIHSFR